MTKEKELKLVEEFPDILKDYGGDMMATCMSWGMECDDGWFDILKQCMTQLQYCCNKFSDDNRKVQVIANQIKEKYGGIRFYASYYNANDVEYEILDSLIDRLENSALNTCEVTGERGSLCSKGGWLRTLSYTQARKLGYKACDEETEEYWKEKDLKNEQN
jgi:hypothetical protein